MPRLGEETSMSLAATRIARRFALPPALAALVAELIIGGANG